MDTDILEGGIENHSVSKKRNVGSLKRWITEEEDMGNRQKIAWCPLRSA
jgi:hypothetical protein